MLTIEEVCRFFGGSEPIDRSTFYRWMKTGIAPKPLKMSPRVNRWSLHECENARMAMAQKRAKPEEIAEEHSDE